MATMARSPWRANEEASEDVTSQPSRRHACSKAPHRRCAVAGANDLRFSRYNPNATASEEDGGSASMSLWRRNSTK